MQIDGHHALTYIAARFAGFDAEDASKVAYSAQYVDDATNGGVIKFTNGAMYYRIASAHKMLDYSNFDELANHQAWAAFHFLPGNAGLPAGENPTGSFIHKLICKPDSFIARDMLKLAIADKAKSYGLHRLGISMHVYADTFAHQGFTGNRHEVNEVSELKSSDAELDQNFLSKITNFFLSEAYPLGHGAALSHPDRPYITWQYKNGLGVQVERDNREIFFDAVDSMCCAMKCFISGDSTVNLDVVTGIPEEDALVIREMLAGINDDDGEVRHRRWLDAIAEGKFSFGAETLTYIAKGEGSWKHESIGQLAPKDQEDDTFEYHSPFLSSDWKMFHDALQAHRFDILHDVLPKYGICLA
ncbi:hypothetical protein K0I73_15310 [Shewanella mesophila]|uniref:DUF6765 family protein n=1 Tax=Shewanella mesophila TaxID=2864208 RepID=UPI001C660D3C|nr:DUF6765 family protein [Shewanella mesophila]QYJ85550.1 hypothetical protein K0I73_15310 [Shewanella mesophila]